MNNNILLKTSNAIFEPHIFNDRELPFIYHNSIIKNYGIANFHENLELLYFRNGSGYVKYDEECYPVKRGDVVVINSYATHQVFSNGDIDQMCLIIDNSFCKYNNIDVSRFHFTPLISDEALPRYFNRVAEEYDRSGEFKYSEIKCAVLSLLLFLCRNYSTPETRQTEKYSRHEYIRLSIEYIKSNLGKKLTVDTVAASVGLSKYHFLREFKKHTGYTLTNYINIIRCEYAKELLKSGRHNVKETALLCGFDNYSYFTNVFKKCTGVLPSAFLKTK